MLTPINGLLYEKVHVDGIITADVSGEALTGSNTGLNLGSDNFVHYVHTKNGSCTGHARSSCQNRAQVTHYHEILDYESNSDKNLCYDILGYNSGLGFNTTTSIYTSSAGVTESQFNNDSLNSIFTVDKLCKSNNFNIFTGVKSSFNLPNQYKNFQFQFDNDVTIAGYVELPGGKLNFKDRESNVPSLNQIRCMYVPGEFSCELRRTQLVMIPLAVMRAPPTSSKGLNVHFLVKAVSLKLLAFHLRQLVRLILENKKVSLL